MTQPTKERRHRRWWHGLPARISATIVLAGAVVGLISDMLDLRGSPGTHKGAVVKVRDIDSRVQRDQFCRETYGSGRAEECVRAITGTSQPDSAERKFTGTVVYVDVHLRGYRDHELQLQYSLYYTGPPRRRKGDITVPFDAAFEVEVDDHVITRRLFVGVIDQPVKVRVDLYEDSEPVQHAYSRSLKH